MIPKKKDNTTITPSIMVELSKIFTDKSWKIDKSPFGCFNKYCQTLSKLELKEQALFLDITKRFTHINQPLYCQYLVTAIKKLLVKYPDVTTYYVSTLTPEKDEGDPSKSACQVLYLFKGNTLRNALDIKGVKFKVIGNLNEYKSQQIPLKPNERILLVDDFMGTGETAVDAVVFFCKKVKFIPENKITILTIVAHKIGCNFFASSDVDVVYSEYVDRGISDYYKGSTLDEAITIMTNIENRLASSKRRKLHAKFRFGYQHSEALVCMERSPNNTFPIYWLPANSPYERS